MKGLSLKVCPSKLLEKKWREKERQLHKQKLRSVKSSIREQYQTAPQMTMNLRNGKKEALMEQRYTEIERENRILLEKMSNIMQNSKPTFNQAPLGFKRSLNRD